MRKSRKQLRVLILSMASAFLLLALTVVAPPLAQAQTFSVLYSFTGLEDGAYPFGGLVRDNSGNLYGTTGFGGLGGFNCPTGCGTVYKIDSLGDFGLLHTFGETGADGENPQYESLTMDAAGNLYGTTAFGGARGSGTAFRLNASGQEAVFSFPGGADGAFPYAGLVRDSAGNFYGVTQYRGTGCVPYGCGTVFKLNRNGKQTVLYSFTGTPDGAYPFDGLVRDSAGNLYGTTNQGGASNAGTVFKVDPAGNETVVYSFTGSADGASPYAGLIGDSAGNLYGTTYQGGANFSGTVFKIDTLGNETVLYNFCAQEGCEDGGYPYAALLRDGAGNLYGTTQAGGLAFDGTVFKLDPNGKETVLHTFIDGSDGAAPYGSVIRDGAGNLYGTAAFGGDFGFGTVFKISR